jgi:hypothetical protein
MARREIPRGQWQAFLESFSLQHETWLVTLARLWPSGAERVEARDRPLGRVALAGADGSEAVEVRVGPEGAGARILLEAPARVCLCEAEPGVHEGLELQASSGEVLRVRFRSAVPADLVDGA